MRFHFPLVACAFFLLPGSAKSQDFRVQIAAYSERQPAAFFKEKGVDYFSETYDPSGIYWYTGGVFLSRDTADLVCKDLISKGFAHAMVVDEAEQRLLSGEDCPYIRDGVVFVNNPNADPALSIIYFESGSHALDADSRAVLDDVYRKMKQSPALTLTILGYTDGIGDAKTNLELSAERSRSARDYLIYKGIRADRMYMEVMGEADPAAPNAEDDGSNNGKGRDLPGNRKWNRRVTLRLIDPAQKSSTEQPQKH